MRDSLPAATRSRGHHAEPFTQSFRQTRPVRSVQYPDPKTGFYPEPWEVASAWLYKLGPDEMVFTGGGFVDWIKSDERFKKKRSAALATGELGEFQIQINADESAPGLVQMIQDGFVYTTWPAAELSDAEAVAWDYQAQIGSYQGTMTVSRAWDQRLRVDYNLFNVLSWESLNPNREMGREMDSEHPYLTQRFVWTEYVDE